jgi:hypothetical protein
VIGFFSEFIVRSRRFIRGFDEPTSVYVPRRNPAKMKNRDSRSRSKFIFNANYGIVSRELKSPEEK